MSLTFEAPDVMKMDKEKGYKVVDREASEVGIALEALGRPKVFYMAKANKYFRDSKCTNAYSDGEITKLGLPIPAEIENKRRKMIRDANDAGKPADFAAIIAATSPTKMDPPEHISSRLASNDPTERWINRLNRSSLGR